MDFVYLCRLEKDRGQLKQEVDEIHSQLDHVQKGKVSADKLSKQLEAQLNEVSAKLDDANPQDSGGGKL